MIRRLSDRIREARRLKGWTQAELARRLGVTASAVGHWEGREACAPTVERLMEVAVLTEVGFEWLATGRGAMRVSLMAEPSVSSPTLSTGEKQLIRHNRQMPSRVQALLLALAESLCVPANVYRSPRTPAQPPSSE